MHEGLGTCIHFSPTVCQLQALHNGSTITIERYTCEAVNVHVVAELCSENTSNTDCCGSSTFLDLGNH